MPLTHQSINGLWCYLRPAFSTLKRSAHWPISPSVRRFIVWGGIAARRLHKPRKHVRPKNLTTALHSYARSNKPIQDLACPLSELSLEALYGALRKASRVEDYLRVNAIAKELVEERGEQPGNWAYYPLMKANTSPQHGSASEVRRLLQQMAKDEVEIGSSIYHAALKVIEL